MSYDISFKVKVEGVDKFVPIGDCDANITWNVCKIIELSTGLPWENEANNGLCKDIIPQIKKGLRELDENRENYIQYEALNGWGSIDGTMRFFMQILDAWNSFCEDYPELINVATFWIE